MTSPDDDDAPAHAAEKSPRVLWREIATVFGLSLVLIHAATFAQRLLPALGPYLYVLVALIFLVIPTQAVLRWRRGDPVEAGMRFGSLARGLRWGLGATLLSLIPFVIGFHLWHHHVLGLEARVDVANYLHWDDTTQGRPDVARTPQAEPALHVWSRRQALHLWWPASAAPPPLRIDAEAVMPIAQTQARIARVDGEWRVTAEEGVSGEVTFRRIAPEAGSIELRAESPGDVPVVVGGALTSSHLPLSLSFSLMWIFAVVLTQVFFVALPEEYFYRGYIQPTLARGDPEPHPRWRLGLFYVTPAILVTSVLFALGHVLVEWHWHRLMVFFPSLAFGWLRERSDGLTAPLIFHAACNLMVEMTAVHYV